MGTDSIGLMERRLTDAGFRDALLALADPDRVAADGLQRCGQPAGGRRHLEAVALDREADRQAVARDDERVVPRVSCQRSSSVVAGRR